MEKFYRKKSHWPLVLEEVKIMASRNIEFKVTVRVFEGRLGGEMLFNELDVFNIMNVFS